MAVGEHPTVPIVRHAPQQEGWLTQMGTAMDRVLERFPVVCWSVFTILFFAYTTGSSLKKGYWFDELVTRYVDLQPDWASTWRALSLGADANPPLMHVLNRAAMAAFGDNQVTQRLSSAVGFWCASLCIYLVVRRKSSAAAAWMAAILPLAGGGAYYATEARAYGLVMAFSGLALLSWQRRWIPVLMLAVAGLASSHFYAIFATIPFWLAEGFRLHRSRRVDWAICGAMVVGYLPLVFYLPLIRASRDYVVSMNYMPNWYSVRDTYTFLLGQELLLLIPLAAGLAFLAAHRTLALQWRWTIVETALLGFFCLFPFVVLLISRFLTHTYLFRYTLVTLIGLSIAVALLSEAFLTRAQLSIALAVFAAAMVADRVMAYRTQPAARTFAWEREVKEHPELPVVEGGPMQYVEVFHGASAEFRKRYLTLADHREEFRRIGSVLEDLGVERLAAIAPMHVEQPSEFVKKNKRFYLSQPPIVTAWTMQKLLEDGAEMKLVAHSPGSALYLVTMP